MNQPLEKRLNQATRRCAQGLLVLAAGTFGHAAWSSQVTGAGIGRVETQSAPAPRPAPASTTTTVAPGKHATRPASRAGSAATR